MKVKFGDLTVRQIRIECVKHHLCATCPFHNLRQCVPCNIGQFAKDYSEKEIDLPDEEVEEDE